MPSIAIIGANARRDRFSNKAIRAYQLRGYDVYPVNPSPREETIEGLPVYRTIADVPVHLDRVAMYVGPPIGMGLLGAIAAKGCDELWLNPGTHNPELVARAESLGLNAIVGCAIVDLGLSPSQFGD